MHEINVIYISIIKLKIMINYALVIGRHVVAQAPTALYTVGALVSLCKNFYRFGQKFPI